MPALGTGFTGFRAGGLGGGQQRGPLRQGSGYSLAGGLSTRPPIQPPMSPAPPAPATNAYTSGIQAGPVYNDQQNQQALDAVRSAMNRPMPQSSTPMPQHARDYLQKQYGQMMHQQGTEASLGLERSLAAGNATQQSQSEQARANSGIQGGNFLSNLADQNFEATAPIQQMLMRYLMSNMA